MGKHFVFCSVRIAIADVYSLEWHVDLSLVPQIYDAAPFLFNPHAQNLTAGSIYYANYGIFNDEYGFMFKSFLTLIYITSIVLLTNIFRKDAHRDFNKSQQVY
jgi:hypothetical protein